MGRVGDPGGERDLSTWAPEEEDGRCGLLLPGGRGRRKEGRRGEGRMGEGYGSCKEVRLLS